MTLHIPISSEIEAKLRARAAELGTDPTGFVVKVLEKELAGSNGESPQLERRLAALDRFVARAAEWTAKLPPGRHLDDSRDSIYEGRGE